MGCGFFYMVVIASEAKQSPLREERLLLAALSRNDAGKI
jgi:hypothetical protein